MWNMLSALRDNWFQVSSMIASFMFLWGSIERFVSKVLDSVNPNIRIKFYEQDSHSRSGAYAAIATYLGAKLIHQAKELNAHVPKDTKKFIITIGEGEEVCDVFKGIKLQWGSGNSSKPPSSLTNFITGQGRGEGGSSFGQPRHYQLTFRRRNRDVVLGEYLSYLLNEARAIESKNRKRKLHTNVPGGSSYGKNWSHIEFNHPSTFDTLAMKSETKQEIISDLVAFSEGEDYYAKIGKSWKRGYLLYGPPGTGKSTLIAAIANYMDYDIYDLELQAVTSNTHLRNLLIDTSSKSLIVIEDIDCSVDLTGKRKKTRPEGDDDSENGMDLPYPYIHPSARERDPRITLSGLLNFIDGLWSSCGSERIIVFTTNHVDQLDPALIRRGRMDLHIEMSYCTFEPFKVLAKNYLDLEWHPLFDRVEKLLGEVEITPADVAETLMRKSKDIDAKKRLEELIEVLETTKVKKQELEAAARIKKLEEEASVEGEATPNEEVAKLESATE